MFLTERRGTPIWLQAVIAPQPNDSLMWDAFPFCTDIKSDDLSFRCSSQLPKWNLFFYSPFICFGNFIISVPDLLHCCYPIGWFGESALTSRGIGVLIKVTRFSWTMLLLGQVSQTLLLYFFFCLFFLLTQGQLSYAVKFFFTLSKNSLVFEGLSQRRSRHMTLEIFWFLSLHINGAVILTIQEFWIIYFRNAHIANHICVNLKSQLQRNWIATVAYFGHCQKYAILGFIVIALYFVNRLLLPFLFFSWTPVGFIHSSFPRLTKLYTSFLLCLQSVIFGGC